MAKKKIPNRSRDKAALARNGEQQSTANLLGNRMAEGGLLASLFLALAFQEIRFEGFEAEKLGLVAVCVSLIVGGWLLQRQALPHRVDWQQIRTRIVHQPVPVIIVILIASTVLSTLFSLSPARSFLGSPSRSEGLLTLLFCAVLFWQGSRLQGRTESAIRPFLVIISIPICLWAVINGWYLHPALRPGSTAGQPNYLADWLIMVLLYCAPSLYWSTRQWSRPWTMRQKGQLIGLAAWVCLILLTVVVTGSRAAFVGLVVVAVFYTVVSIASLEQRRRLLIGLGAVVLIGGAAYLFIARIIGPSDSNGVVRFFQPYDQPRVELWTSALKAITRQSEPLMNRVGQPDPWAALRLGIGYGPEIIEQTQSRFGNVVGPNVFVDSFHNNMFDALAMGGVLGLLALVTVYQVTLYRGLRWLGLVPRKLGLWFGAQIVGVMVGSVLVSITFVGHPEILVPVGLGLGSVGGLIVLIGIQIFTSRSDVPPFRLTSGTIPVFSLLAVVVAEWISGQFGFAVRPG